jgi:hypothetical protein
MEYISLQKAPSNSEVLGTALCGFDNELMQIENLLPIRPEYYLTSTVSCANCASSGEERQLLKGGRGSQAGREKELPKASW